MSCARHDLFQKKKLHVLNTVKHVYSDYAYNEMTLSTKHLEIPGKTFYIYIFINVTLTAKLHITKSRL